jgi:hypothetical protein
VAIPSVSPDSGTGPVPAVGPKPPLDTNTTQDQKQGIPLSPVENTKPPAIKTLKIEKGSTLDGYRNPQTGKIDVPLWARGMVPDSLAKKMKGGSIDPKDVKESDVPPNMKDKIKGYGGSFSELRPQDKPQDTPGSDPSVNRDAAYQTAQALDKSTQPSTIATESQDSTATMSSIPQTTTPQQLANEADSGSRFTRDQPWDNA